jgi:hypothetical protein
LSETLGSAVLDLSADLQPLDRDLATGERRVALSVATMQTMLDRNATQIGQRLGAVGASYDRELAPPVARFGTAVARMGQQVDGSLSQIRIEQAATAREAQRAAVIAEAAGTTQAGAAARAARAYGEQAAAAKASANVQEAAALKLAAVQRLAQAQSARVTTTYGFPAAGGGGRGGGIPPAVVGGGDSGGGGNGILRSILWGKGAGGGGRMGGRFGLGLLLGGGALAGAGTVGSFAGFGAEHALFTAGGVAGSAGAGAIGGGLMALGSAGQMAVGGGSDMAVMKSTITDTKELATAYGNVQKAVTLYGVGSKQAVTAQKELNLLMAELGNTAGVKAELGLAKQGEALNKFWDKATSGARVQAVNVLSQVLKLGMDYVPRVAQAAQQNLAIINKGVKPLFSWLEGPEGVGVWNQLEGQFKKNLPTAVHAFDQAMELLLKTTAEASKYTGGFIHSLDKFFTKYNSPAGFAVWRGEMGRLIGDFHLWWNLIKVLGRDIFDLFTNDAHTGNAIVETITNMLTKLGEWERSTKGREDIHNVFTVHKEEIVALLKILPEVIGLFSKIYLTIAPPMVEGMTGIAKAITWVLKGLNELGPAMRTLLGFTLIALKLGQLGASLRIVGGALGLVAANTENVAIKDATLGQLTSALTVKNEGLATSYTGLAASEEAAAAGGVAASAGSAGGLSSMGALLARGKGAVAGALPSVIRGATVAGAGALAGNIGATALGLHGTANLAVTLGTSGAALGTMLAPGIGTAVGGAVGVGLAEAIGAFNNKAPEYGKQFARGFVAPFAPILGATTTREMEEKVAKARNAQEKAEHPEPSGLKKLLAAPGKGLEKLLGLESDPEYSKPDPAKVLAEARKVGQAAGDTFAKSFSLVRFPTTTAFFATAVHRLDALAVPARQAAAKVMIAAAQELEAKGQLPSKSVAHLIGMLEAQFPHLASFLQQQGAATAKAFSTALNLKETEHNVKTSLDKIAGDWGLTGLSIAQTEKALTYIIAHSKGEQKAMAERDLRDLRRASGYAWQAMQEHVESSTKEQAAAIGRLAVAMPLLGASGFTKYEALVQKWVEGLTERVGKGIETLKQGILTIDRMLAGELTKLGMSKGTAGALTTGKLPTAKQFFTESPFGAAGGGLIQIGSPGEAGHDSVPLNVGGMPVMVAPGEQVAVFNRHQLPIVDAALAPMGGLAGLFQQVDTPHYMAQGGLVGKMVSEANKISAQHFPYVWGGGHGSFQGPFDCSGAVSAVLHAAGVLGRPETSGELASFGAPGPGDVTIYANPIHTFMSIMGRFFGTHGSEGAGWYAGSALPGYAVRHVTGAGGLGTIGTPKVKGAGAIAALARAGLGKAAAAANRYLAGHSFGAAMMGGSEANVGHMVPGIMGIEQRAAGIAGLAWNPSIVAALLSHESGGGINEPPSGSLNATGPNQIIPSTFASYALAGHKQISNPLDNAIASMRYIKARYGSLAKMASTTGLLGGRYVGYARGGLFSAGGGVAHSAGLAKAKAVIRRGKGTKPKLSKATALKLGFPKLGGVAGLSNVPGMMMPFETATGALGTQEGLLESISGDPNGFFIGPGDMQYLSPTLVPGEGIGPGMSVLDAQGIARKQIQASGETEPLQLQQQILEWIAGQASHRMLMPSDISILAGTFGPSGLSFRAGSPLLGAESENLRAQLKWMGTAAGEKYTGVERGALEHLMTKLRRAQQERHRRNQRIRKVQKIAFDRYTHLKEDIKRLTTGSLKDRVKAAQDSYAEKVRGFDATEHRRALTQSIAEEKKSLYPNGALIQHQEAALHAIHTAKAPNTRSITSAHVALLKNELTNELTPLQETLKVLGGSSTSIGSGGEYGKALSENQAIISSKGEAEGKLAELLTSKLPQAMISLRSVEEAMKDSPVPEVKKTTTAASTSTERLLELEKEGRAQEKLALLVSQAQYKVLSNLPPFAGKFHDGGIVPGPLGQERTALVLAGERISPAGSGDTSVRVIVHDGAVDPNKIEVIAERAVKKSTRSMARSAGRPLPSRGGGMLG